MIFPALAGLAGDMEMNRVSTVIKPIPYLEDDPFPPVVREERWRHGRRPFPDERAIVPQAQSQPLPDRKRASMARKAMSMSASLSRWGSALSMHNTAP